MEWRERPKLRRLGGRRIDHHGRPHVVLDDPHGLFPPQLVTLDGYLGIVRHFDGRTPLAEIQSRMERQTGQHVPMSELRALVEQWDRAMVLDSPTFRSFLHAYQTEPVRPAALAGRSYPDAERALRGQLNSFFEQPRAAGRPRPNGASTGGGRVRGVLSPHIDFARGGHVYTWAYRSLVERCDADVFVVFGVAHQGTDHRFALTRKDFFTPLGTVLNDSLFMGRLLDLAGSHLLEDELTHRTEHSIEFQVVWLQHVLGGRRPFTIVPILVGSFHDLMAHGIDPIEDPEVARFVGALQEVEATCGRSVAYVGGIDLAHVGPQFGDTDPVDSSLRAAVQQFDTALIERATACDPRGWFATAGAVQDRWRVCGLAATYTMLHAMGPAHGTLLQYDQAVDPMRTCCVTFASVAYEVE